LSYQFQGEHWLGVELLASGDRKDVDAGTFATITNPGYAVVNLFGSYKIDNHLSLSARIENVFDKDYDLVDGYNTAETAAYITLSYQ